MTKHNTWVGKKMMNPKGEIGEVIVDDNSIGRIRILTVKFKDNKIEYLELSNIGENPKESQEWSWEYTNSKGKKEWVKWGY